MSDPRERRTPLVICSKSTWEPAIRREHSLARLAAAHGHPVTFLERPLDVRALRTAAGARAWWRGLRGGAGASRAAAGAAAPPPGVRVQAQSTLFPGHLNAPSELTSNLLLRARLNAVAAGAAVVVNVPWQWPATAAVHGRRVFDCADDWRALAAHRSERIAQLYGRIGREADLIIVAGASLAAQFPAERTVIVPNGVSEEMLGELVPAPAAPRLLHAGTLSPRFDAQLAARLLDLLPDWSLDLYGQCQYPGCQERPGAELEALLAGHEGRIRWHGVVDRVALSAAIDGAAVALVLNRPEQSQGQDSMKLYDYAARGRPVVTTRFAAQLEEQAPPHTVVADDADAMAAAIGRAREDPAAWAQERRSWAEQRRWSARWSAWSQAVFGDER